MDEAAEEAAIAKAAEEAAAANTAEETARAKAAEVAAATKLLRGPLRLRQRLAVCCCWAGTAAAKAAEEAAAAKAAENAAKGKAAEDAAKGKAAENAAKGKAADGHSTESDHTFASFPTPLVLAAHNLTIKSSLSTPKTPALRIQSSPLLKVRRLHTELSNRTHL